MSTSSAQQIQPGDRPAGNLRGTRSPAVGRHGMIATSQTLASAAGLKVLQDGGNAIDAAVTAAAVLAVVEPSMNGIGGDLLAIVYDAKTKKVYGLDSTGRSAYAATPEEFTRRGLTQMPGSGPLSVDVPGVVEGWHQLLDAFGTITLAKALAAGDRLCARRLPGCRDHGRRVAGRGETLAARSAQRPRRSCRTAARRRTARSSPIRAWPDPRTDRRRTAATRSTRAHRARDRRRHASARRLARRARLRRPHGRLGRADLDQLSRLRRARDAAEHAGLRRARDAEHPRGLRHRGDGPQLRGLPAPPHRSQEIAFADRARISPIASHAERRAADPDFEGLRRDAAKDIDMPNARRAIRGAARPAQRGADVDFSAATSATRST